MTDPAAKVKRPFTERWLWLLLISGVPLLRFIYVVGSLAAGQADELRTDDWILGGSFVVMLVLFLFNRHHEARKRSRSSKPGASAAGTPER